jgi:hypothetical protein
MENISLLKKIEAYIKGTMSTDEAAAFKSDAKADPELDKLLEEYKHTMGALKREWLSFELNATAKALHWSKLFKIAGISLAGIATALIYFLIPAPGSKISKEASQPVQAAIETTQDSGRVVNTSVVPVKDNPVNLNAYGDTIRSADVQPDHYLPGNISVPHRADRIMALRSIFKTDTEYFSISNLKDTIIQGKEGTLVYIPASSLVNYRTKKLVSQNINIRLCEFTDYYSMFKANVSTLCNGQLLNSGGSCYLAAYDGSDSVILKYGKSMTIGFTCGEHDTLMSAFYGIKGADGVVKWQESNDKTKSSGNAAPSFASEDPVNFSGDNTGKLIYDTLYYKKYFKTVSLTTGHTVYNHLYEKDFGGGAKTWESFLSYSSNHKDWGDYILKPVIRMPYSSVMTTFSEGQTVENMIRSGRFGLINCDHFMKFDNLERVNLLCKDTMVESYLFFKSERSCYPSFNGVFENIPQGSKVRVLSIFTRNNKIYMNIMDTTTKNEIYIDSAEPLDSEKIKQALNEISKRKLFTGSR